MPNRIQNPRIADVEECAPSCLGDDPWLAVALDVRKAHRLLKVARCDQALLAFSFEGRFFHLQDPQFRSQGVGLLVGEGRWHPASTVPQHHLGVPLALGLC